ncbi:MAG: hypothetical protein C5B52_04235 [Bacteroidetes bacterium]|nr:MAG: hypothetical protein C5B52_04235 [Bacteroidota bacterium]
MSQILQHVFRPKVYTNILYQYRTNPVSKGNNFLVWAYYKHFRIKGFILGFILEEQNKNIFKNR